MQPRYKAASEIFFCKGREKKIFFRYKMKQVWENKE